MPTTCSTCACCPTRTTSASCAPLTGRDAPVAAYLRGAARGRSRCWRRSRPSCERWLPALRRRPAQLPDGGDRLHRRPAPLGVPRRAAGRGASPARAATLVRHRELDARRMTAACQPPTAAAVPAATVLFPGGAARAEGVRGALPRPGGRVPARAAARSAWSPEAAAARCARPATPVALRAVGTLAELDRGRQRAGRHPARALPRHAALRSLGAPRSRPTACGSAAPSSWSTTTRSSRRRRRMLRHGAGAGRRHRARCERRARAPFLAAHRFDDAGWVANRWCEILPIPLAAKQKLMELETRWRGCDWSTTSCAARASCRAEPQARPPARAACAAAPAGPAAAPRHGEPAPARPGGRDARHARRAGARRQRPAQRLQRQSKCVSTWSIGGSASPCPASRGAARRAPSPMSNSGRLHRPAHTPRGGPLHQPDASSRLAQPEPGVARARRACSRRVLTG